MDFIISFPSTLHSLQHTHKLTYTTKIRLKNFCFKKPKPVLCFLGR